MQDQSLSKPPRRRRAPAKHEVAEVRRLQGDNQALVVPEDKLPRLAPKPPADLTNKAQRELWTRIVKAQEGIGLLRESDHLIVLGLVRTLALADRIYLEELKAPFQKKDSEGQRKMKQALTQWRALQNDARKLMLELGMSPASRERFIKDRSESARNMRQAGFDFNHGIEE